MACALEHHMLVAQIMTVMILKHALTISAITKVHQMPFVDILK
jgi:hypothetical protein